MRGVQLSICLLLVTLCGCGGGDSVTLYSASGTVTKAGKPIAGISVTFTPDKGPSSGAVTNAEGKFILICSTGQPGAVAGKHKVTLNKIEATSQGWNPTEMAKSRSANTGKRGAPIETKASTDVPAEYGDAAKSPLKFEVKTSANTFEIPIP